MEKDHNLPLDDQALEFDRKVRTQLLQAFTLVEELEEKLQTMSPEELSQFKLRSSFIISLLDAIDMLNGTIKLLLSPPESTSLPQDDPCNLFNELPTNSQKRAIRSPSLRIKREKGASSSSPLASSSAKLLSSPTSNSPPSEQSDDSPTRIPVNIKIHAGPRQVAETTENVDIAAPARENSRKRKSLPKVTIRIPGSDVDQAREFPPDDGFVWRKYGQKEILGTRYPRSYFRCIHKSDLGCEATKQVQKCDEDCSMFEVTYKGEHICRSTPESNNFQNWPYVSLPQMMKQMQFLQGSYSTTDSIISPNFVFKHTSDSTSPLNQLPFTGISQSCSNMGSFFGPASTTLENLVRASKLGTELTKINTEDYRSTRTGMISDYQVDLGAQMLPISSFLHGQASSSKFRESNVVSEDGSKEDGSFKLESCTINLLNPDIIEGSTKDWSMLEKRESPTSGKQRDSMSLSTSLEKAECASKESSKEAQESAEFMESMQNCFLDMDLLP